MSTSGKVGRTRGNNGKGSDMPDPFSPDDFQPGWFGILGGFATVLLLILFLLWLNSALTRSIW